MRTTSYFRRSRGRSDRISIQDEWIRRVIEGPQEIRLQTDGRIQIWGYIAEVNRYLRVVVLEDHETVHNAFFDRSYGRPRR